jgi:hypothetical protein
MSRKNKSSGEGRFVTLTHELLKSAAWRTLSSDAVKLYLDASARQRRSGSARDERSGHLTSWSTTVS